MSVTGQTVRQFVSTFNRSDLDGFVATLDPRVELHSVRGLKTGREQAREWATRIPGGVQQTVVIRSLEERNGRVLLEIDREWHWAEDGTHASTDEMAWLFTVSGGLVTSWRPFEDRSEAHRAFTSP